jgi:predicted CXXCH cytochrome family protein
MRIGRHRAAGRGRTAAALGLALVVSGACRHGAEAGRAPPAASPVVSGDAAFVQYPADEVSGVRNVHLYRGKPLCQGCHTPAGVLAAAPIALCKRCHGEMHPSHPVDMVQKTHPEGLPLLPGGRVACHTCHDPHLVATARGLRKPFNALCESCHRK